MVSASVPEGRRRPTHVPVEAEGRRVRLQADVIQRDPLDQPVSLSEHQHPVTCWSLAVYSDCFSVKETSQLF